MNKKDFNIIKTKNKKITMITAYDALMAKIFDGIVDIILVGDSLSMSFKGDKDTLSITLDDMIYHTKAVKKGAKNTFIVCDMPFGSYLSKEEALRNAVRIYKESGANAVKLEGGEEKAEIVKELTKNSIAVMGHIGLMPQSVRAEGGYKIKGKNENEKTKLLKDAKALEDAGAFCIVLEGVKENIAKAVSESVSIPTIGIGSGKYTDGQVLVWSDMLGFFDEFKPKFVKRYLEGAKIVKNALKEYVEDIQEGRFPLEEHCY